MCSSDTINGKPLPAGMKRYSFLDKDSIIQCEEIRAISKARLDYNRGKIGVLTEKDFLLVKQKMKRTYDL
jgi:mRNA-degrading endonuclease toxin of MazEF toxin-antitoxin module